MTVMLIFTSFPGGSHSTGGQNGWSELKLPRPWPPCVLTPGQTGAGPQDITGCGHAHSPAPFSPASSEQSRLPRRGPHLVS